MVAPRHGRCQGESDRGWGDDVDPRQPLNGRLGGDLGDVLTAHCQARPDGKSVRYA